MRYIIRAVTLPAAIPLAVSVDDAKAFMKVETTAEDDVIEGMIRDMQAEVEKFTGRVLTERVLEMVTCGFPVLPELISLPRTPVTEIVSIKYSSADDGSEVEMDPADWRWSDNAPDQVLPAWRQSWPVAADEAGSLRVRFEAGYGEGLCPPELVGAVKKAVMRQYDARGAAGLGDEIDRDLCGFRPLLF